MKNYSLQPSFIKGHTSTFLSFNLIISPSVSPSLSIHRPLPNLVFLGINVCLRMCICTICLWSFNNCTPDVQTKRSKKMTLFHKNIN